LDIEVTYLETVHLFVELVDSYFSNVGELDIVFNFNQLYTILDEFILAGEMEESLTREILEWVKFLEKMQWNVDNERASSEHFFLYFIYRVVKMQVLVSLVS
jgi:hypothetical protein